MAKNKEKGASKISWNRENYAKIYWILYYILYTVWTCSGRQIIKFVGFISSLRWNCDAGELKQVTEIIGDMNCSKRKSAPGCGADNDDNLGRYIISNQIFGLTAIQSFLNWEQISCFKRFYQESEVKI